MDINNFDDYEEFTEWRPIIINGIKTNYDINDIGQIRSKMRPNKITKYKILKPLKGKCGYLQIRLYVNGKIYSPLLHRLVAQAFIPNPDNLPIINHKNGVKTDNRVENLEWCTQSENIKHSFRMELSNVAHGSDCNFTKYNEDQVKLICQLLENKINMKLISYLLNISYNVIRDVKNGYSWSHVSFQYNIDYNKRYKYKIIKYNKLKKILISLNIFNDIDLSDLLYSEYIVKKKQLLDDLEEMGWEICIDSKMLLEL